jgi:hypothetical protein
MRHTPVIRAATLAVLIVASAGAQSGPADKHLALVRSLYSGERALETVAFLDKFVRWPGNVGFDSSIAHVASRLAAAGYIEEAKAKPTDRLT